MFPYPQDALPLPPRANLERYRKLAKELVKASESADADAIAAWSGRWLDALARLAEASTASGIAAGFAGDSEEQAPRIARFARLRMSSAGSGETASGAVKGALARAQFVIARCQGFASWARFSEHVDRSAHADSSVTRFEAATDTIVAGEIGVLEGLLKANPGLARGRSTREHGATLLHYLGANGVENYRQRTARDAVEMAEVLLAAGAEVDAVAAIYGGSTTLELAATSVHPRDAGVQIELMEKLLAHGAALDRLGTTGQLLVHACLANGQPRAAEFLAKRGAAVDVEAAAGLGWLDAVKSLLLEGAKPGAEAAQSGNGARDDRLQRGFFRACEYGRDAVVKWLMGLGADLHAQDRNGQTGLHWAVIGGSLSTVRMLVERGAPLDLKNGYGGTALGQARWSAEHGGEAGAYASIIELLTMAEARAAADG